MFSYLLSFANFSSMILMPAFASFSNTKYFQSFVLQWPKQIKRFKSLLKFLQIGNTQNLGSGFIQHNVVVDTKTAPQHN